jgi:hypothetical protein
MSGVFVVICVLIRDGVTHEEAGEGREIGD